MQYPNPSQSVRHFGWIRPLALALLIVGLTLPAHASHHVNTITGLTLEGGPLALRGYDPVAYFTEGRAVLGKPTVMAKFDGAVYQFSSETNKQAFEKDPARYVPQYGGFCAYGVSLRAKFDSDPAVFKIVDGKLYLNLNRDIQKTWEKDVAGNLRKADQNWNRIRDVAPLQLK
jgi:hypothetical protein